MKHRSSVCALVVVAALVSSVGVFAQKDKKKEEAQKKELPTIIKIADDLMAGQPGPNDLSATWVREDHLKAAENKEYAPFTVSLDASKITDKTVALYWRVVARAGAPGEAAAAGQAKDEKQDKDKKSSAYAYEDITFVQVSKDQNPLRIARSFTVSAGTYDVYVVAKEPEQDKKPKNAPPRKVSAFKQVVTVPDFWNGELATSSVMVAERIDPLAEPLTPAQLVDRPYAFGAMEIQPAYDTKISKKAELSTFLMVYNPKVDSGNKPDVLVEYSFCQAAAGSQPKAGEPCKAGEKFFNKTSPQSLNATTLPPQFDFAAGHQLQTGQAVPLASFPEGDYRLEIIVTDKIAKKSLTRDVNFSVVP